MVIGRNQNPWLECDLKSIKRGLLPVGAHSNITVDAFQKRVPVDLVRRRSGGGTVFHDEGNLNYSVIVPNDTSFKRTKHAEMVVRAIKEVKDYNWKADVRVNERNDIVMKREGEAKWLKISGSAFKLIRGRALHHGTLLYSSPYLEKIGSLLRSPGREMIRAKGVESVRSKVGNLHWTSDEGKRNEFKEVIVRGIIKEFLKMYGDGLEVEVGDEEVQAKENGKISQGVEELKANDWRFLQTPRFEFESGSVDGLELKFDANRGTMGNAILQSYQNDELKTDAAEVRLYEVKDWSEVLRTLSQGVEWDVETLASRLEAIFPRWHG